MKIWIGIEAPDYRAREWGRAAQAERTNVANLVKLLASRIELGCDEGSFTQNGMSVSFKTEQTRPAAEGEAMESETAKGPIVYVPMYYILGDGKQVRTAAADLPAMRQHPDQWRDKPWSKEEVAAYKRKHPEAA